MKSERFVRATGTRAGSGRCAPRVGLTLLADAADGARVEGLRERVELGVEGLRGVLLRVLVSGKVTPQICPRSLLRRSPHDSTKPATRSDLREDDVDGDDHLEARHHLVDARAERARVRLDLLLVGLHQVRDADRDDDAVDRLARAVLREEAQERQPLLVVVGLDRVAAGRVEEDAFVGEPPVAVARAADAAYAAAAGVEEGEDETGVLERRRLAGARRADDDVPGQRVERARARLPELARLERLDALLDLLLQVDDLGAAVGLGVGGLLLALLEDLLSRASSRGRRCAASARRAR